MVARRPYAQRERAYIVDFVRTKYPYDLCYFNFRLGGLPAQAEGFDIGDLSSNIWKVFNRYVDALVVQSDRLILLEAKILADLGAVSQLEYYSSLVKTTPELAQYLQLPVELHIVTASGDPAFIAFAQAKNIIVDIYRTQTAVDYLKQLLK